MPVWTVTTYPLSDADQPDVATWYVFASQDAQVVNARLDEGSVTTLVVDTGPFERPVGDLLYDFLREYGTPSLYERHEAPAGLTRQPIVGFTNLTSRVDEPNANGDVFSAELRERIIQQYLEHPEARSRLAQSMAAPLYRRRDDQAIARAMFPVEQLPPGARPIYTRDPDTSWIKPGVWAKSESGITGQVIEIKDDHVYLRIWRLEDAGPVLLTLDDFARTSHPIEEPKLPPTWYERLEPE